MFGRVLLTGVLLIAIAVSNAFIISETVIRPLRTAAFNGGCLGSPPVDTATCTRLLLQLDLAGRVYIEVVVLAIVGSLLLLLGLFLTKPLPDRPLGRPARSAPPDEDVSSEWRDKRIPAKARIVLFGSILTLFAGVAGSVVVPAVVLAFFAFLLTVWRHRLTPRRLERSFLLPLGLAASLVGYVLWGITGLIAAEDAVITITGLVIALSFLRY